VTTTSPWYEQGEQVFLLDYLQFGNTLRLATVEPQMDLVRANQKHGVETSDERLKFAAAIAAQQLGHAYEDLAAILAALTCRHDSGFMFRGRPTHPAAQYSLWYTLLNYQGTLSLASVVDGADARLLAARCAFPELGKITLPSSFHPNAATWVLDGLAEYLVRVATPRADIIRQSFLKLKHGGVAVCDARLFSAAAPEDHIGIGVAGDSDGKFKLVAIPATPAFVTNAIVDIDRVRVAISTLTAFYLQRYYPNVWTAAHVSFEQMLDERVRKEAQASVLVGWFDLQRVVPSVES
jgi:hypothetical protein